MDAARFATHLNDPVGRGPEPAGGHSGAAGGAACGDLVRLSVAVEAGRVAATSFDASGCGAALAAGSAAVALVRGKPVLDGARVGPETIAAELGGLSPAKHHAAELAADALHRSLGAAVRANARLESTPGRTLVAMSGGVDSAVAAVLCGRGGETVGVTLELWADRDHDAERSCCSASAVRGARALAHEMGLPHLTLDLREEFRAGVVSPFLDDHAAGLTPNPCVRCNGHVRLDAMIELAERLGADALATGHYARVAGDVSGPLLRIAADPGKDQSYMLAALAPASLERLRFPLGDLEKPRVRELAAEAGLAVADKPDSQDLCFLAGTDRAAFLARHGGIRPRPGEIVDHRGRALGRHRGHHGFTVGQRRGLGVATPEPLYVLEKDASTNRVVVGPKEELATRRVRLEDARLHRPAAEVEHVRLRYHAKPIPCRALVRGDGSVELELASEAHAVAPGQLACLMRQDRVVGEGTIGEPR
jgi:tRNA-specific 2-thiouridylase